MNESGYVLEFRENGEYPEGCWFDAGEGFVYTVVLGRIEMRTYEIDGNSLTMYGSSGESEQFSRLGGADSPVVGSWAMDLNPLINFMGKLVQEGIAEEQQIPSINMSYVFFHNGIFAMSGKAHNSSSAETYSQLGYWAETDDGAVVYWGEDNDSFTVSVLDGAISIEYNLIMYDGRPEEADIQDARDEAVSAIGEEYADEYMKLSLEAPFTLYKEENTNSELAGVWIQTDYSTAYTWEFSDEGSLRVTALLESGELDEKFKYEWHDLNNGRLGIYARSGEWDDDEHYDVYTYSIVGNYFTSDDLSSERLLLIKEQAPPPNPLISDWESAEGDVWRFLQNGVIEQTDAEGTAAAGQWQDLGGGRVSITSKGDTSVFAYELTENKLTLRHEVYLLELNFTEKIHPLIGKWEDSNGVAWIFNNDGKLQRKEEKTAEGEGLDLGDNRIHIDIGGDSSVFICEFTDDDLTLTHEVYEVSIALSRN
jgi:hypothetical protein